MKFTANSCLLGLSAVLFSFGSSAIAGPIITDWTYSVNAVFDTTSPTFTNSTGCQTVTGSLLSWGSCTGNQSPVNNPNRSGIGIDNSNVTGVIQTNGAAGVGNTYVHYNNTATTGTLKTAVVNSSLTLSSLAPEVGINFGPATLPYFIQFVETANGGPLEKCVVKNSKTSCADIFVITGVLENIFVLDGNTYKVNFFAPTGELYALPDEVCLAAKAAVGCEGFTTQEREISKFTFNFTIANVPATAQIPEPSSLALLGLGLIAAVGSTRRGIKKAR